MSDALSIGANKDIAIRDASTVIMVREVDAGVEICMLMRNLKSDFVGGAYVFPGGAIDGNDYSPEFQDLCPFFDDDKASQALGLKKGGLGFFIAAIRESFEEAGILLASLPGDEEMVSMKDPARAELFLHYREELNAHRLGLIDIVKSEKLSLRPERLKFHSRWITPVGPPRRYDTRFFLVDAPKDQTALHDRSETVDSLWIRPQDALDAHERGEFQLIFPTIKTLESIAIHKSVLEIFESAPLHDPVEYVQPRIVERDGQIVLLLPGDDGY